MAVSRSPKMTPEKRQGASHDADDDVFEADNHGDRKDRRHHGDAGDSDEEVVLQIERDHHPELNTTPPSKIDFPIDYQFQVFFVFSRMITKLIVLG